jgi:hypothetical protein
MSMAGDFNPPTGPRSMLRNRPASAGRLNRMQDYLHTRTTPLQQLKDKEDMHDWETRVRPNSGPRSPPNPGNSNTTDSSLRLSRSSSLGSRLRSSSGGGANSIGLAGSQFLMPTPDADTSRHAPSLGSPDRQLRSRHDQLPPIYQQPPTNIAPAVGSKKKKKKNRGSPMQRGSTCCWDGCGENFWFTFEKERKERQAEFSVISHFPRSRPKLTTRSSIYRYTSRRCAALFHFGVAGELVMRQLRRRAYWPSIWQHIQMSRLQSFHSVSGKAATMWKKRQLGENWP